MTCGSFLHLVLFCLDAKKDQKRSRQKDAPRTLAIARPPFCHPYALVVLFCFVLGFVSVSQTHAVRYDNLLLLFLTKQFQSTPNITSLLSHKIDYMSDSNKCPNCQSI